MKIDNAETLAKSEGFWTKPRPLLDQWLALAGAAFMMLLNGGWYTVVLFGVIVLGGLFAPTFRFMRPQDEI